MTKSIGSTLVVLGLAAAACSHGSKPTPGTTPVAAPTASTTSAELSLPFGVTSEMVARGDTIFNARSCKNCHAMRGIGGVRGPDLTDDRWVHVDGTYASIVGIVTTGFTKAEQREPQYQFSMNPRGGTNLTDDDIRAVAAYVWSLSRRAK